MRRRGRGREGIARGGGGGGGGGGEGVATSADDVVDSAILSSALVVLVGNMWE